MYAVLNEYDRPNDDVRGAEIVSTTDSFVDAITCAADIIADVVSDDLDDDSWERVDIIEVSNVQDAIELLESGDYYETGSLFHWDTSII